MRHAQHWARALQGVGRTTRWMPSQFVKPYGMTNKNDVADAEAMASNRKVELAHVARQGGEAPMLQHLAGGLLSFTIGCVVSATPYIDAGRLRATAVAGDTRIGALAVDLQSVWLSRSRVPGAELARAGLPAGHAPAPGRRAQERTAASTESAYRPSLWRRLEGHSAWYPSGQLEFRRDMVNAPTPPKVEPLADALEDAKQATESVKEAAEDLAVIHAVLHSELPAEVRQGDAGAAVDQTKSVEKQLGESAELLDQATGKLEREVKKRKASARKRKSK